MPSSIELHQPTLGTISTPKWRSALNRLRQERSGGNGKFFLLALVALGFWAAVFGLSFKILSYIQSTSEVGVPLAGKFRPVRSRANSIEETRVMSA